MRKSPLALSAIAVLLALAACSSSDNDDSALGGENDPGDSSQFNPDLDNNEPPASGPGDDATVIAGLWDASAAPAVDERYVEISADGRYSNFTADADGGNCFVVDGPYTMELEIEASSEWSTSNGLAFVATSDAEVEPRILDIQFTDEDGNPEAAQSWPLASGIGVEGVQVCTADPE